MILLSLALFTQSHGDTLRWYDIKTAGWNAMGINSGGGYMKWGIIWPVDSNLDGRIVHSGRSYIWEPTPMPAPGTMKLCLGTTDSPTVVLDSGSFYSTGQGFYEVFFGDTIALHEGDLIWLWCNQLFGSGQFVAGIDSGPAVRGYGDLFKMGNVWMELYEYGLNYNWVMELILTPTDVEEGPAKPEEKFALIPVPGGFWIAGYSGSAQIYDPAGRLVLSKEIKGKTLIGPLRRGIYFVVAGKRRARVAVR
ncbi:MAG: hypothetical protein ACP5QG_00825 [candidate division WOR-3 bacterium]